MNFLKVCQQVNDSQYFDPYLDFVMLPSGATISVAQDKVHCTEQVMDMEEYGLENFLLGNYAGSLSSYGELNMCARGKQLIVASGKVNNLFLNYVPFF